MNCRATRCSSIASAVVAILLDEPERRSLENRLDHARSRAVTSPIAVYETVVALMRVKGFSRAIAAERVQAALTERGVESELVTYRTLGDKRLDEPAEETRSGDSAN